MAVSSEHYWCPQPCPQGLLKSFCRCSGWVWSPSPNLNGDLSRNEYFEESFEDPARVILPLFWLEAMAPISLL